MKIAIIGGGNGGQAMAGHFSYLGHEINWYIRNIAKVNFDPEIGEILLKGEISGIGKIKLISNNLAEVIKDIELIMVVTVANAHRDLALQLAPLLEENQIIVLNPGRTFGALEFRNILNIHCNKKVFVAETQSLLYACRAENNGEVRIIGVKDKLPVAAIPSTDTNYVVSKLKNIYPSFIAAKNILETSLENIGCIFHPSIVLFNAAKIERGESFYFYNDMTPAISHFIEAIDKERLAIGNILGANLLSASEWISYSYKGIEGVTLCDKMKNNPAYYKIMAPKSLDSRLLTEDIPTGILPLIEIAKIINVHTPLLNSIYNIATELLATDFRENGRTLKNLKIEVSNVDDFLKLI